MRVAFGRALQVLLAIVAVTTTLVSCTGHQPDSGPWVRYSVGGFSVAHPPGWIARPYRAEFNGPEGDGQVLMGNEQFSSPCITTGNEEVCNAWPHAHLSGGGVVMAWTGGTGPQTNRSGKPSNLSLNIPLTGLSRPASYTIRHADADCAAMGGTQQMSAYIGADKLSQQIAIMDACIRGLTPTLRSQLLAIVRSVKP